MVCGKRFFDSDFWRWYSLTWGIPEYCSKKCCDDEFGDLIAEYDPPVVVSCGGGSADPLMKLEDDPEGNTVHQPFTAYNQGFEAAEQGIPVSLNPYDVGSREHSSWEEGHETWHEQREIIPSDEEYPFG